MKEIAVERARIEKHAAVVSDAEFFNSRLHREDLEWLILAYLVDIIAEVGWPSPQYAEKLHPPNPDFQTFMASRALFRRVEVTEVLRPEHERSKFYRENAASEGRVHLLPKPHPLPWSSFLHVLQAKLAKPYASDAWLVIYHNMSASEFNDFKPWHERVLSELQTWRCNSDLTCDITRSSYECIYVVDASGQGAVRLHPHWDVVRPSPF